MAWPERLRELPFSRLLRRNWRLKALALGLAVLLWITVRLSDDRVTTRDLPNLAPVRVENLDSDWVLRGSPSPASVRVSVTGRFTDLFQVASARPVIVIPVDSVVEVDWTAELLSQWVREMELGSLDRLDFEPSTVRLRFERKRSGMIPISPRFVGAVSDSLAVTGAPGVNPLFTKVQGPASLVDGLETVFLEPFDLSHLTDSGQFELLLDTTGLVELTLTPPSAVLTMNVASRRSRTIGPLPIELPGATTDIVAVPESLSVIVRGAAETLQAMDAAAVTLRVGYTASAIEAALAQDGELRAPVILSGLPGWTLGVPATDSVILKPRDPA